MADTEQRTYTFVLLVSLCSDVFVLTLFSVPATAELHIKQLIVKQASASKLFKVLNRIDILIQSRIADHREGPLGR